QRRQAFQMGAARQAPHSQETERVGDRGVPSVARYGNSTGETARDRLSWGDGGAVAARAAVQGDGAAGHVRVLAARAARARDGASVLDSARARRGDASCRDDAFYRRSSEGREGAEEIAAR